MIGFAITFFEDFAARTKTEENLTLDALAARIRSTTAPAKDGLPWLKLSRFGSLPTAKGSLRWNGNLLGLSGVVADYDAEKITPGEAAEKLDKAGIVALVYTSPSHFLNGHGPRWRVVCPFARELPPDRHYQMMARLNGLLGGILGSESFTLSQAYYFGSVNGNPAHAAVIVDGIQYLDQADELDEIAVGKSNSNGRAHTGGAPEAPIEDIRAALAVIPNPLPSWGTGASWSEWNMLGLTVWCASGGSHEGREAFHEWSKRSPKYDRDETEFRWSHFFDSPPDHIGFGSLVFWARQIDPNWQPPSKSIGLADLDARAPPLGQEQINKPPTWTLTRPSEWAGRAVSSRIFIMEDWIPQGEYIGLYGVGGVRKTDFLLQLLMASSAMLPFCGFPLMHCVTYGLFCEDTEDELMRRVDRIAEFYGADRAAFTGFFFASLVTANQPEFVNFDSGRMIVQDTFHAFEREVKECGAGLAALDTLTDFFGGEEISRRHVSQFLRLLGASAVRNRCAVIGSRHPSQRGKSTGTLDSGSTGWEGKERARLTLRDPALDDDDGDKKLRKEPSNKRILTRAKSNYARPGEEIELVFEDGGFKRVGPTETPPRGQMRDIAAENKFLELLRKFHKLGRRVHDARNNPDRYAPKAFAAGPDRDGFSEAEFKRAMNRLFGTERIRITQTRRGPTIEVNQ